MYDIISYYPYPCIVTDHPLRPPVPQGVSRAVALHEDGVLYLQVSAAPSCGVSDYLCSFQGAKRTYTVTHSFLVEFR